MIYLAQVNKTTTPQLAKRLKITTAAASQQIKRMSAVKQIQRLPEKVKRETLKPLTQFILSHRGEDITLKILNIKRPDKTLAN
jgi:hypothetical protein